MSVLLRVKNEYCNTKLSWSPAISVWNGIIGPGSWLINLYIPYHKYKINSKLSHNWAKSTYSHGIENSHWCNTYVLKVLRLWVKNFDKAQHYSSVPVIRPGNRNKSLYQLINKNWKASQDKCLQWKTFYQIVLVVKKIAKKSHKINQKIPTGLPINPP